MSINEDASDMKSAIASSSGVEITRVMDLPDAAPSITENDLKLRLLEIKRAFVQWAKLLLPHFCLIMFCCAYVFFAAAILHKIESQNEQIQQEKEMGAIIQLRNEFREHMWNIAQDEDKKIFKEAFNVINEEYFNRLSRAMIRNQYINEKHLLNETTGNEMLWTFSNSIFFATTVFTTIGYGNLVPATTLGRVACLIFALFGIPLLQITIGDLSKFLSECLMYFYRTYRAKIRRRVRHHQSTSHSSSIKKHINSSDDFSIDWDELGMDKSQIPLFMIVLVVLVYTAMGGFLFKFWEDLPYFDASYSCFMRMMTVGFGVNVPTEQMYMFFSTIYLIFGLTLGAFCIDIVGILYIQKLHYMGRKIIMRHAYKRANQAVHTQE